MQSKEHCPTIWLYGKVDQNRKVFDIELSQANPLDFASNENLTQEQFEKLLETQDEKFIRIECMKCFTNEINNESKLTFDTMKTIIERGCQNDSRSNQ